MSFAPRNPRYEWLLVELTVCVVLFAGGMVCIVSGCPAAAHGQQLAPVPAGQFRADVSGETLRDRLTQQRQRLAETQYQQPCYGQVQVVRGPAGPPGQPGPKGDPGEVDYAKVNATIASEMNTLRADLRTALETLQQETNQVDVDLGERINDSAAKITAWAKQIDDLQQRLDVLATEESTGKPTAEPNPAPSSAPVDFPTLAMLGLGIAGIGVPWWVAIAIRGVWRAWRRASSSPADRRPPVQPFRTTDATDASAGDTRVAGDSDEQPDGYYEDGE